MGRSRHVLWNDSQEPYLSFASENFLNDRPDHVDLLPVAIYVCDATGRLLWFNRKAAQLWGRVPRVGEDAERFCGSFRLYLDDGTPVAHDRCPMAAVIRTGEPVHGRDVVIERPDGSRMAVTVHIDAVKNATGAIIGAINCFHESTALYQANTTPGEGRCGGPPSTPEAPLAGSDEQFRRLVDWLPAAIYITDAAGNITYFNQAAVELAGRRPQIGDRWCVTWRLYRPDGTALPHDECPMAITLKESRPVRGAEAVAERPDGTRVPFLPFPTPIRDSSGTLIGAVNLLVDISERKQSEANQKALLDELNHRVKNNVQLLHALLKGAERETKSAEARRVLAEAAARVAAMGAAQIVLYRTATPTEFEAEGFLHAVCASAKENFGEKVRIAIKEAEGRLAHEMAVPLALILHELLLNAAKHAVRGRKSCAVEVSLSSTAAGTTLCVQDDGPGYERVETRSYASGLGLVTGMVRQIGASFSVERRSGARCVVHRPM